MAKSKTPAPSRGNFADSDYVNQSFMRRLAPATLEIIARSGLGVRWHNAANKAMVAAVLCSYIIQNCIDGHAAHYDSQAPGVRKQ